MPKLTWRPDVPLVKTIENKKLVRILHARYFTADGNETETLIFDQDVEYFEGLVDAGFREARAIQEALQKHSSVRLQKDTTSD